MGKHIKILDLLRGIAALGVVLYHFSDKHLPTLGGNYLADIFFYGQYGVQVFFVISGFVIPYSMNRAGYEISGFWNNIIKRYIRICPPSYVAMLLSFVLHFAAVFITGKAIVGMHWPGLNFVSIFGNLTYTVQYLDTGWFNPVFWSLAIEFQFYIIIGLLLPLLMKKNNLLTSVVLVVILLLGNLEFYSFFKYGSYFVLGMIVFIRKEKLLPNYLLIILTLVTVGGCYYQNDLSGFIFAMITFIIVLSEVQVDWKVTNFLGKISYSLYITHWAVGAMAEIALKRVVSFHENPHGQILMMFVYTMIAIGFATLFYHFIEKPFLSYSRAFSKRRNSTA